MKGFIESERWPGRGFTAHNPEIKKMFGLDEKTKWPAEGMPERVVQGITLRVVPLPPAVPGKRRRFIIRAQAQCPACASWFGITRLRQHWPACKQRDNYTGAGTEL